MSVFVADAHADTLYAMALGGLDPSECMVRPQALAAGGVGLATFALFAGPGGVSGRPYQNALKMLARTGDLGVPLLTGPLPLTPPAAPHGILSIEGGEILEGRQERLAEFSARGVRMVALTWNNKNQLGYPALGDCKLGLTACGIEMLSQMDALGILCDVSHLNEAGFEDALSRCRLPVIASHSNLRSLCGHARNLWPAQARAIFQKRGFIGINFYAPFLAEGRAARIDDVIRHIEGFSELGGIECIGFGSDFDGIERWPEGLGDPSCFPRVLERLYALGYTQDQIAGIAGLNYYRVLLAAQRAKTGGL
jgi:microsomal dipeptidase-like Zn-dependent dipeptidase